MTELVLPIRGLIGKWETVGDSMDQVFAKQDVLRKLSWKMEHLTTGLKPESLRDHFKLLKQMLFDPEHWFNFLVCHEWNQYLIQEVF